MVVQAPFTPVIVYTVVVVGVTTIELPVNPPGLQVYDVAPEALRVALLPAHNAVGLLVANMVGVVLTLTATVAFELQIPFDPVTV